MSENVVTKFLKESPTRLQTIRDTRAKRDEAVRETFDHYDFVVEVDTSTGTRSPRRLFLRTPAPQTSDTLSLAQVSSAAGKVLQDAQRIATWLNARGFRSCAIQQSAVKDVIVTGYHGEVWIGVYLTSRDTEAIAAALDLW